MTALIADMLKYPLWAGKRVVECRASENPHFPPSAPALRKWLEDEIRPYRFAQEWDERARLQVEERKRLDPPMQNKPTYQEIKSDLARRGLFIGGKDRYHGAIETSDSVQKKYGLSREQWDAIPNRAWSAK
jgi:hypothetical protein